MTDRQEQGKRCRELTMGCWWPSRYYPKPRPNWAAIADELTLLREYPGQPADLEQLIAFAQQEANR